MSNSKVILVIPAYNEAERIAAVVKSALRFVDRIVVIDDGSTDGTAVKANTDGGKVFVLRHRVNLGKGAALKTGCEAAVKLGADIIVMMDGDGQHPPEYIPGVLEKMEENKWQVVFTVRQQGDKMPFIRYLGNEVLNAMARCLFCLNLRDIWCGFRAFRAECLPLISWQMTDYSGEIQMALMVGREKLSYGEFVIPTIYKDEFKGVTILHGLRLLAQMVIWRLDMLCVGIGDYYRFRVRMVKNVSSSSEYFLRRILVHAKTNVFYYGKLAIKSGNISLNTFPILTKALIRNNFDDLKSGKLHKFDWFRNASGGSTGEPLVFIQNKQYLKWRRFTLNYFFKVFLNINPNFVPKVIFWGSEKDILSQKKLISSLMNKLTRTYYVNSFRMSVSTMTNAVRLINVKKPVFIRGYVSSLYEFARFVRRNGIKIHKPSFLISSAETLQPFMRSLIEQVFKAKVYDLYGAREVGIIAGECKQGKMHVFSFNNFVEIVDDDGNSVVPGGEGKILVTNLHNYVMPFIRYEIGDRAIVGRFCSCNSDLPVLERISGRISDNFITRDGALIHGEYFTHLFYFRNWVKEFQVLQETITVITILVVLRSEKRVIPKNEQDEITNKILLVMGNNCQIRWKIVKEIKRTPQGKFMFTRSLVYGRK